MELALANRHLFLYRVVYQTRFSLSVCFLLLSVFILHPLARAEASALSEQVATDISNESVAAYSESIVTSTEIPLPPAPAPSVSSAELSLGSEVADDSGNEQSSDTSLDDQQSPPDITGDVITPSADTLSEFSFTSATVSPATGVVLETALSSSSIEEGSTTTLPGGNDLVNGSSVVVEDSHATATTIAAESLPQSPVVVSAPSSTELATTSSTTLVEMPLTHESYSDAEVRFLRQDCVAVEGGAYYCHERIVRSSVRDALISEPDSNGDLEIFLVKDGEYHQLTNNDVDDAAPAYDGRSESMVWHRLLSNTYVVYEFDFNDGVERALTSGVYNDMQPTRFGDRTVWQRWIDDYWQIMLLEDGVELQLTTAEAHHVAPVIRGDVILWQTVHGSGEKRIETLDLLTGVYQTIEDPESAAFTNPRMMMVYEAVYDNGDVVTRGVDLKTGKVMALDATPTELPTEIPETDSTGETRALIGTKSVQKDTEGESGDGGMPDIEGPDTAGSGEQSLSTHALTLDLRSETSEAVVLPEASLPLEPGDLVLLPLPDVRATTTPE